MVIKNTTHRNVCQQCIVPLYEASWLVFERATSLKHSCLHSPFLNMHEMWNDLWSLLLQSCSLVDDHYLIANGVHITNICVCKGFKLTDCTYNIVLL